MPARMRARSVDASRVAGPSVQTILARRWVSGMVLRMWWLLPSGLAMVLLYGTALTIPDWGLEFTRFASVYALLMVAYLAAAWGVARPAFGPHASLRPGRGVPPEPVPLASASPAPSGPPAEASERRLMALIWAGAVVFRLLVLTTPPTLSDDLYRYLWDGHVLLHGINPYRYAPNAPELAALRDALWARLPYSNIPTIYPPLLQLLFAAVTAISHSVTAWKVAATLFDLGTGWFLVRALAATGRPRTWAALYLWHPLVVVEFAGSGHADSVGLCLVAAALAAWAARRWTASGVALTLAGLVKFLPWVALPALLPRLRWRWAFLPVIVAALYLPFQLHGVDALGSLGVFAAKWRANDFLFTFLFRESGALEPSLRQAKLWGAIIVGVVWLTTIALRRPLPSVYAWTVGALLLVSPVAHPWYVLWLLPAAVLCRQPAWWLWTITVFLAYAPLPLFRAGGPWRESMLMKGLEVVPVLALLPVQAWWEWQSHRKESS